VKPCDRCGDTSPPDAHYCIGCGAPFGVTGPTQRLVQQMSDHLRAQEDRYLVYGDGAVLSMGSVVIPYTPAPLSSGSVDAFILRRSYGYGVAYGSAPSIIVTGGLS